MKVGCEESSVVWSGAIPGVLMKACSAKATDGPPIDIACPAYATLSAKKITAIKNNSRPYSNTGRFCSNHVFRIEAVDIP